MRNASVGIDVGGTFTDLVAIDAAGIVTARKVLTTPGDQSVAVEQAVDALGAPADAFARVVHGTTVATNALLERSGARVVLCATDGTTDLLDLRRQERASLYDLTRHHPDPLVPPARRVALDERMGPHGVVRALGDAAATAAARDVVALDPEIVAVALLHAYADPRHEHVLRDAIARAAPGLEVVLSSDVLPEIREYERTATTVAEAYLRPAVARYLSHLDERLRARGLPALAVMTSAGGLCAAADAARAAAALALSGPAGGVVGAAFIARQAGVRDALTIDVGGTSADAGVILDGEPLVDAGSPVAGVPIALTRVLVETVSAGGGSIAWIDDAGALRVGPRSAGAVPGPAAFGRGGAEVTVTDAHVVLGTLSGATISGGVTLDAAPAHAAIARLAARLDAPPERVAGAIVRAADAAVARALRRVSVERGIDPRRCTLIAFGGGGPLHACALAEQLGMRTVLVPPHAGVLSAVGLALAAERRDAMASVMRRAAEMTAGETRALGDLLAARAGGGADAERRWWARARYEGQGHELEVSFAPGDDGAALAARFHALHGARYGFTLDRHVEIVAARHAATRGGAPRLAPRETVDVVRGPDVVTLSDATMLVARGWTARPAAGGYLVERDR